MLKKKTLFLSLAVVCLSLCSAAFGVQNTVRTSAEAISANEFVTVVDDASCFTVNEGTLTAFTVPASVTGYFEVKIPSTVTRINARVFDGSVAESKLTNGLIAVEIPASVEAVETEAFYSCNSLVEACILNTDLIGNIEESGVGSRSVLSTVSAVADKSLAAVSDASGKYLVVRNGGTASTAYTVVKYAGEATSLSLPAPSVLNAACKSYDLYNNAFENGTFTSLTLPQGVTAIGSRAFENCSRLANIALNEGLLTIGGNAFVGAPITAISIPASVTEIGSHAFENCSQLTQIAFAARTDALAVRSFAFANCTALKTVTLPKNCTVNQEAFGGCTSLQWVYAGENTAFNNTAETDALVKATFFPTNTPVRIVFPTKAAYDGAVTNKGEGDTFKKNHAAASTYVVNVNCYVGASTAPIVYKRLHGEGFNFVCDETTGNWNTDTAYSTLPVQAESYASTVWYTEQALTNKVTYDGVNTLLASAAEINLYCHETVAVPSFPAEPVSWVYDSKISYDITDLRQVLKAMGCTQEFTDAQLSAMQFEVVYASEDGKVADTPDKINQNGVYSVTVSLNGDFGSWAQTVASTATVNVDTSGFNVILIVFLVIGVLAVIITVSTAIIRKKVQQRNKKKQISQQEVLDRYRAAGGETSLK